jgi:hypothetical protein
MTHSGHSARGVPPINLVQMIVTTNSDYLLALTCVWFSEGSANGKEAKILLSEIEIE